VASLTVTEPPLESVGAPAIGASDTSPGASDLKSLLEAHERSLILAALGAVGGRQRSAAELLRILPSTLCEKMKRLGIGPHRAHKPAAASSTEVSASLHWKGSVAPGGTLEVRGLNGPVRLEAGGDGEIEVWAVRRGPRSIFSAIEVKVVEHGGGVTVCAVCQGVDRSASRRQQRRVSFAAASVRVDLVARVPPGVHVIAHTVNDDIEVVGLTSNVQVEAANGRVRFLPVAPGEAK
jgi:Bacterial regulatory protein, Fis family